MVVKVNYHHPKYEEYHKKLYTYIYLINQPLNKRKDKSAL